MLVQQSMKPEELGNSVTEVRELKAASSRKSIAKKEGTRWGTLEDWRVGGKGEGESSAARRNRLRDGR